MSVRRCRKDKIDNSLTLSILLSKKWSPSKLCFLSSTFVAVIWIKFYQQEISSQYMMLHFRKLRGCLYWDCTTFTFLSLWQGIKSVQCLEEKIKIKKSSQGHSAWCRAESRPGGFLWISLTIAETKVETADPVYHLFLGSHSSGWHLQCWAENLLLTR